MHMNHWRSVSDMLVQVRADAETIHVESGKMDGEEAIIIAAVGPMALYVRRMLESQCRRIPAMQTTLEGDA